MRHTKGKVDGDTSSRWTVHFLLRHNSEVVGGGTELEEAPTDGTTTTVSGTKLAVPSARPRGRRRRGGIVASTMHSRQNTHTPPPHSLLNKANNANNSQALTKELYG